MYPYVPGWILCCFLPSWQLRWPGHIMAGDRQGWVCRDTSGTGGTERCQPVGCPGILAWSQWSGAGNFLMKRSVVGVCFVSLGSSLMERERLHIVGETPGDGGGISTAVPRVGVVLGWALSAPRWVSINPGVSRSHGSFQHSRL